VASLGQGTGMPLSKGVVPADRPCSWLPLAGAGGGEFVASVARSGTRGHEDCLAILTDKAFVNFTLTLEFMLDDGWASAGVVIGATSAAVFYEVGFPFEGQQNRAEHFWGTISRFEHGWRRSLAFDGPVHSVSSTNGLWHSCRVRKTGALIEAFVDGIPLTPTVMLPEDHASMAHTPTRVGISTYHLLGGATPGAHFRKFAVVDHDRNSGSGSNSGGSGSGDGSSNRTASAAAAAPAWPESPAPALRSRRDRGEWGQWRKWEAGVGNGGLNSIVELPDGTLVALERDWARPAHNGSGPGVDPAAPLVPTVWLMRSATQGRSWKRDPAPMQPGLKWLGVGAANLRVDPATGFLEMYGQKTTCHPHGLSSGCSSGPPFTVVRAISKDGRSFGDIEDVGRFDFGGLAAQNVSITQAYNTHLLALRDNRTLLLFGVGHSNCSTKVVHRTFYVVAHKGDTACVGINFVMVSNNSGKSFMGPIDIDGSDGLDNRYPAGDEVPKGSPLAALELSAAESLTGEVIVLTRPFASPYMWEARSPAGAAGSRWRPMARGPFPLYACCKCKRSSSRSAIYYSRTRVSFCALLRKFSLTRANAARR
jgi:hypothetical protein